MQILGLAFLSAFLVIPVKSYQMFQEIRHWERNQIAIDNAAIISARADRAILNKLLKLKRTFKEIEKRHHVVHLCASLAKAKPDCLLADKFYEAKLSVLETEYRRLYSRWAQAPEEGLKEGRPLSANVCAPKNRSANIVSLSPCTVCGKASRLILADTLVTYHWSPCDRHKLSDTGVKLFIKNGKWGYALFVP